MGDHWCTIESDPGVFSELLERMGVKGVQVSSGQRAKDDGVGSGIVHLSSWRSATLAGLGRDPLLPAARLPPGAAACCLLARCSMPGSTPGVALRLLLLQVELPPCYERSCLPIAAHDNH